MHVSAVESIELDPFVGPRGVEFKVRISPALVLQESNRFLLGSSNSICVKHMVRTLSAGSTTQSPRDHAIEIVAHRAHNAPRGACRGLVHDRLGTKPSVDAAAPTRTGSIATANPDA